MARLHFGCWLLSCPSSKQQKPERPLSQEDSNHFIYEMPDGGLCLPFGKTNPDWIPEPLVVLFLPTDYRFKGSMRAMKCLAIVTTQSKLQRACLVYFMQGLKKCIFRIQSTTKSATPQQTDSTIHNKHESKMLFNAVSTFVLNLVILSLQILHIGQGQLTENVPFSDASNPDLPTCIHVVLENQLLILIFGYHYDTKIDDAPREVSKVSD